MTLVSEGGPFDSALLSSSAICAFRPKAARSGEAAMLFCLQGNEFLQGSSEDLDDFGDLRDCLPELALNAHLQCNRAAGAGATGAL